MIDVEARNVTRRYGDVTALDGVDVRVRPGKITCVLGASGSGKSTLVRLLHLLQGADEGEILVDGRLAPMKGHQWLETVRRFSLVQQRPGLLRATAIENVAFPLRARGQPRRWVEEVATEWLSRLGLASRARAGAANLSGGEAQRVALARALCTRPDVLLVDEGTNQLDPLSARLVEGILKQEGARGCAVLLVTHNVPQAKRMADEFVFLEAGRVLESGSGGRLAKPDSEALQLFLETG